MSWTRSTLTRCLPVLSLSVVLSLGEAQATEFERVTDFFPPVVHPPFPAAFRGALYFGADAGDGAGQELWRYDGTNAVRVTDIAAGAAGSFPEWLAVFDDALYFSANG